MLIGTVLLSVVILLLIIYGAFFILVPLMMWLGVGA